MDIVESVRSKRVSLDGVEFDLSVNRGPDGCLVAVEARELHQSASNRVRGSYGSEAFWLHREAVDE